MPTDPFIQALLARSSELEKAIRDEQQCEEILFLFKWPEGFRCRTCGHDRYFKLRNRANLYVCSKCKDQQSLRAGTILESTRASLTKWFKAILVAANSSVGMTADQFREEVGLGSRQTAWSWLHKIREAMAAGAMLHEPGAITYSPRRKKRTKAQGALLSGERERTIRAWTQANAGIQSLRVALCADGKTFTQAKSPHGLSRYSRARLRAWLRQVYRGVASWKHAYRYLNEFTFRRSIPPRLRVAWLLVGAVAAGRQANRTLIGSDPALATFDQAMEMTRRIKVRSALARLAS